MAKYINAMLSAGKVLGLILLIPLSFCVALPIAINEVKALNWLSIYSRMPHPSGTERIALRYSTEKISNSDECDFKVLEARSYSPGQEIVIEAFYAGTPNPFDALSNALRPEFIEESDGESMLGIYAQLRGEVAGIHQGPYYLLVEEILVPNYPPIVDWRCV